MNNLLIKAYVALIDKKGQGVAEYALILAGVAVVVAAAVFALGVNIKAIVESI